MELSLDTTFLLASLATVVTLIWWFRNTPIMNLPPGPRGLPIVGNLDFGKYDSLLAASSLSHHHMLCFHCLDF